MRVSHTPLRRLAAATLLVFLTVFQLEGVMPDICDGDATAAQLAAFAGAASDLPDSVVESARAAVAVGSAEIPNRPASDDAEFPAGPHSTHACHCVHAHGGTLAAAEDASPRAAMHADAPSSVEAARPASMTYQPPQRPPLA